MLHLPDRTGPRPTASSSLPHRQLNQNPPAAIYESLAKRIAEMDCEHGPSLVSVPGAQALFLSTCRNCNERFGFIRGREFAHLHPAEDGSLHLALTPDDLQDVLVKGWGEFHPWVHQGRVLPNVVMVYAPRSAAEVDLIMSIVAASMDNARLDFPI
jgi:hypothetical protein